MIPFYFSYILMIFFLHLNFFQNLPIFKNKNKKQTKNPANQKWQQNKKAHKNHRAMESVGQLLLSMGPALKEQDTHVWNQRLTACIRPVQAHIRQIPGQRREVNTVPNHPPRKWFAADTCRRGKLPSRVLTFTWYVVSLPSCSTQCLG